MTYLRAYILFCFVFCLLFSLLIRRKAYRSHPAFFAYIAYVAIWQTAKLVTDCIHPIPVPTWLALYRIEAVVEQVLSAWVCVSLLWEAFFPVIALSKRTMTLWLAAIPTLAMIAVLLPQVHPILTLDRVAYFAMTGAFAIVVLQFGDSRVYIKTHSYGVGLGFLLLLVAGVVRSALVTRLDQGDTISLLTSVAVCVLWGGFFLRRDLPCRTIFGRNPEPDGRVAKNNLEELENPDVHVLPMEDMGPFASFNSHGIGTTFFVHVRQIQLKSSIRMMEAVKLAEFERYLKKHPQSETLKAKSAVA